MARVTIENLTKIFTEGGGKAIRALDNVNLAVEEGELLVIVGPSGCGKTTLLRTIAGLEDVTEGTIFIDGQVVNNLPPKERDIAMVFQQYALYPHMSVYENMAFGLKLRKCPRMEIETRVSEAAAILGLTDCLDRKPNELSGGQRQRVAVGRAIVRQPKVFLFDEPLSNLDPQMRMQMRAEISKLHTRLRATIIYVTHDQIEAMGLGDRIAVLKDGAIQQVDEPLTVYHHPGNMFVAGFIGSPPMNFFNGILQRNGNTLFFHEKCTTSPVSPNSLTMRVDDQMAARMEPYVGKKIVLGIRPENIAENHALPSAAPDQTVDATVEAVEPTGAETFVYFASATHSFVARMPAAARPSVNQELFLVFDMTCAHFFDPATERAI